MATTDQAPQSFQELQAVTGMSPAELFQMATEWGFMKKESMLREAAEAKAQADREAADEEARRVSLEAQPKVKVEWIRQPATEHECVIGGRRYFGKGPIVNRAFTPPRVVKHGEVQELPAPVAVVLEEGGMVTVLEGRELCAWTPVPFMPGIQNGVPDPGNLKAWERLAS